MEMQRQLNEEGLEAEVTVEEGTGRQRAAERLAKRRAVWADTPTINELSRQQRRYLLRQAEPCFLYLH